MTRIYWSIFLILAVFLQRLVLNHILAIQSVSPDVLLVLLSFYAVQYGRIDGVAGGFIVGLIYDGLGTGVFGLSALTNSVAGFIFGSFSPSVLRKRYWGFPAVLAAGVFVHDVLYQYVAQFMLDLDMGTLLLKFSLPATLYTVFIGELIHLITGRRNKML